MGNEFQAELDHIQNQLDTLAIALEGIQQMQEEIIEKLDNISTPGGDFNVEYES